MQAEVLNQWFDRRNENDIVLKMNTGSGKTVVGLLILKSCLNESKSPAVYISPDNYLASQIRQEAQDLGLEVTDDPNSLSFDVGVDSHAFCPLNVMDIAAIMSEKTFTAIHHNRKHRATSHEMIVERWREHATSS